RFLGEPLPQPRPLPPSISLAASFNLTCGLSPVPGRPASPGPALPPPISLATSFNLVCLLSFPVPQPSVSPAPRSPARRFRPAAVLPATTEWTCWARGPLGIRYGLSTRVRERCGGRGFC